VPTLTCYIKISVGYFELKLHIHTPGTSTTYFTSCEKGIIPPLKTVPLRLCTDKMGSIKTV